MLMELLESCLSNPTYKVQSNSIFYSPSIPDYSSMATISPSGRSLSLKLDTDADVPVLSVIESNKFKQTTTISLDFTAGDDTALKEYLSDRLAWTEDVATQFKHEKDALRSDLKEALQENAEMREQLAKLR